MNICFIANYNKTYFFYEIAKVLSEKYDINVYWIVVNKTNNEFLENEFSNILYLPKYKILETDSAPIGEFKLNELIFGDRILKYDKEKGHTYLKNIQRPIYNYIKGNEIKYIFGELTWAHELLIHRILKYSKELNCKFLNPHTIRIPNGRFAFFEDEFQSKIYEINSDDERCKIKEEDFIPQKPDYLALNNEILQRNNSIKGRLTRLKKLLSSENLDKEDITLPERWSFSRLSVPISNEVNKETYKTLTKVNIEYVKNKKFVLLTLHKQPEASIDVLGRYMEDQLKNIVNIWKQLPSNWWLVIKEHTNAIGDRPLKFYKDLLKYRNIVFIDEKTDSYQLLKYCQLVVTVSGTIAYEAALLKKKALVLSDVFFNFSYVKRITLEELKYSHNLFEILDSIPNKNVDDNEMKKYIYENSFDGLISDPLSNPKCINKDNIHRIVQALKIILK